MNNTTYDGTISYVSRPDKGFGFVVSPSLPEPVFFHASQLKNVLFPDVKISDKVTFSLGTNHRGKVCIDIIKQL